MRKRYYLATTGISEVWDLSAPLLILGPWCLTNKKNVNLLKDKNYLLIDSPWKPPCKIKEAADYCHYIYEELLPRITECLNEIHGVFYPIRYWRVLIGLWLLDFINVLFERYTLIKNVIELYPDFYTHILPVQYCDLVSYDTFDFHRSKLTEDVYNLKLFSLILQDLCPERTKVKVYYAQTPTGKNSINISLKHKLFNCLLKIDNYFFNTPIVLTDMYHLTPIGMLLLKVKMGFKKIGFIEDYIYGDDSLSKDAFSAEFRKALCLSKPSDEFQSLLFKIVPKAMPLCYLENYNLYKERINTIKNINSVKVVGSAVGWFCNEVFKFFAAEAGLKGARLIEFQHGGGFGTFLALPYETISLEKDKFYTWGWSPDGGSKVKPLPSPHLSKLKNTYSLKCNKLLFIGTTLLRYHYRFSTFFFPDDITKYFEDKKFFFDTLIEDIKKTILYRPYKTYEHWWNEKEKVRGFCPNINFAEKGRLVNWMKKVRLVVIDHPQTSLLEALTINAPCVFYWNHDVFLMRPEAEEYFEQLRKAGIVYKDPESAAKKVNEIYDNPMEWWLGDRVQKARQDFCDRYALADKNWLNMWVKELKQLV